MCLTWCRVELKPMEFTARHEVRPLVQGCVLLWIWSLLGFCLFVCFCWVDCDSDQRKEGKVGGKVDISESKATANR